MSISSKAIVVSDSKEKLLPEAKWLQNKFYVTNDKKYLAQSVLIKKPDTATVRTILKYSNFWSEYLSRGEGGGGQPISCVSLLSLAPYIQLQHWGMTLLTHRQTQLP